MKNCSSSPPNEPKPPIATTDWKEAHSLCFKEGLKEVNQSGGRIIEAEPMRTAQPPSSFHSVPEADCLGSALRLCHLAASRFFGP